VKSVVKAFESWSIAVAIQDVSSHCPSVVEISEHLISQVWHRVISPFSSALIQCKVGTGRDYGEVLPTFVSKLLQKHKITITDKSNVIDIGSGVGNIVTQISMMTGCRSLGIEVSETRHELAQLFLAELDRRLTAWNLPQIASKVELCCRDMLDESNDAHYKNADVIFVNNRVFTDRGILSFLVCLLRYKGS
jgi:hypothetical protein